MTLIACGGRDYRLTAADVAFLDAAVDRLGVTAVFHGGASGADAGVDAWARSRNLPVTVFPADWRKHGRAAGPIRNQAMIDAAEPGAAFVAFPGGRGTADCTRRATAAGLTVLDPRGA